MSGKTCAFGAISSIQKDLKSHNDSGFALNFNSKDQETGHVMGASVANGKGHFQNGSKLFGGNQNFKLNLDGECNYSYNRTNKLMNRDVKWSFNRKGKDMLGLDSEVGLSFGTQLGSKKVMGQTLTLGLQKNIKLRTGSKGVTLNSMNAKVDVNAQNMGVSLNLDYSKHEFIKVMDDGENKKQKKMRFSVNRVGFWRQKGNNRVAVDSQWDHRFNLEGFQVYGSTKLDDKWKVGFKFQPSMKDQDTEMQVGFEGEVYDKTCVKATVNTNSQATVSLVHHPNKNLDLVMTNTFDLQQDWKDAFNPGFTLNLKS